VTAAPSTVTSIAEVEAFAMRILRANGLTEHQAGPIARAMAVAASRCARATAKGRSRASGALT